MKDLLNKKINKKVMLFFSIGLFVTSFALIITIIVKIFLNFDISAFKPESISLSVTIPLEFVIGLMQKNKNTNIDKDKIEFIKDNMKDFEFEVKQGSFNVYDIFDGSILDKPEKLRRTIGTSQLYFKSRKINKLLMQLKVSLQLMANNISFHSINVNSFTDKRRMFSSYYEVHDYFIDNGKEISHEIIDLENNITKNTDETIKVIIDIYI